ncbi:uncharacterized protein LOC133794071 [Humulus lupulus]|uniref:uncharacterized protein LOC133794067 n=1 Tax=Humulus lupulus TaxID=3486 RepID=UPI002B412AB6|nr:uncharacterized protein LOC133794067 [Humulus lupulus]XP_062087232.1 uncharacterized protein LOC133794071 [Humulus lupulus]
MVKTRVKVQGKLKSTQKKRKKRGPVSTADVHKTKSMAAVLGIEPIHFSDEETGIEENEVERDLDIADLQKEGVDLSPKSTLQDLQQQQEIREVFSNFLVASKKCLREVNQGGVLLLETEIEMEVEMEMEMVEVSTTSSSSVVVVVAVVVLLVIISIISLSDLSSGNINFFPTYMHYSSVTNLVSPATVVRVLIIQGLFKHICHHSKLVIINV